MISLKFLPKAIPQLKFYLFQNFKRGKSYVTIVEVGPRDGLQYEKVNLSLNVKVDLINRLSNTGLKRIESGSFVNPKLVPQLADSAEVFATINRKDGVRYSALVPNIKGLKNAIQCKVDEIAIFGAASEEFSKKNINCSIEESFDRFKEVIRVAKDHKLSIRGYLSCVVGCPYSGPTKPSLVANLAKRLFDIGCFEVSLGDTIGIGTPDTINNVIEACLSVCHSDQLALHCHDTNGMALANIARAIELGIRVIDSSIAGLGGCPFAGPTASGNVATERVVDLLQRLGVLDDAIDRQAIEEVAKWISEILKKS